MFQRCCLRTLSDERDAEILAKMYLVPTYLMEITRRLVISFSTNREIKPENEITDETMERNLILNSISRARLVRGRYARSTVRLEYRKKKSRFRRPIF